jgi:hypothetical protein
MHGHLPDTLSFCVEHLAADGRRAKRGMRNPADGVLLGA